MYDLRGALLTHRVACQHACRYTAAAVYWV